MAGSSHYLIETAEAGPACFVDVTWTVKKPEFVANSVLFCGVIDPRFYAADAAAELPPEKVALRVGWAVLPLGLDGETLNAAVLSLLQAGLHLLEVEDMDSFLATHEQAV